jgi:esterase/lipase superfamily enzyme
MVIAFRPGRIATRIFLAILLAVASYGCAGSRAVTGLGQHPPQQTDTHNQTMIPFLVATTREPSNGLEPPYVRDRSLDVSFSQIDVNVPSTHRPGRVETASNSPDPNRHFTARNFRQIADREAFKRVLNARLAQGPPSQREVFIFVHGYNNNFADGLFRNAQIVHDYRITALPVHFSWASAASISGYVFDRDSALIARNGLAETIEIVAQSNATGIVVVGHSMGAYVVMEALRTLALQGKSRIFSKLHGVMLAAPDIDPDVFRSQVDDMRVLPEPFTVVVSRHDRALQISRLLSRGGDRIGSGTDVAMLQKKGIQVNDISKIDGGTHTAFAGSDTLIQLFNSDQLLRGMITSESTPMNGGLLGVGQYVIENTSLVIHLPVRILGELNNREAMLFK